MPSFPAEVSPSSPLLSVSESLIPRGPSPPPSTATVSLNGLLDPPLARHQSLKEGCGGQTWPAGMVLSEFLIKYKLAEMRGKNKNGAKEGKIPGREVRILELGAGSGLVSLALSLAISQKSSSPVVPPSTIVDSSDQKAHSNDHQQQQQQQHPASTKIADEPEPSIEITATDIPPLLPLLQRNIALNTSHIYSPPYLRLQAEVLSWGYPLPSSIFPTTTTHPSSNGTTSHSESDGIVPPPLPATTAAAAGAGPHVDILLAADCVYYEPAFPLLISTMQDLMPPPPPPPSPHPPPAAAAAPPPPCPDDDPLSSPDDAQSSSSSSSPVCYFAFKKRRRADMQMLKMLRKAGFGVRDLLEGVWGAGEKKEEGKARGEGNDGEPIRQGKEMMGSSTSSAEGGKEGVITREDGKRWRKEGVYLWEIRRVK